jgi:hypothetical protein
MYALSQLPAVTDRRVWDEVYERRTGKGIRVSSHWRGPWNDSEREEILATVVADVG